MPLSEVATRIQPLNMRSPRKRSFTSRGVGAPLRPRSSTQQLSSARRGASRAPPGGTPSVFRSTLPPSSKRRSANPAAMFRVFSTFGAPIASTMPKAPGMLAAMLLGIAAAIPPPTLPATAPAAADIPPIWPGMFPGMFAAKPPGIAAGIPLVTFAAIPPGILAVMLPCMLPI